MRRFLAIRLGLIASFALTALPSRAQQPGDQVRIETTTGVVEGTLVDRLPDGYLIRSGERSLVVPYASVRALRRAAASAESAEASPAVPPPAEAPSTATTSPPTGPPVPSAPRPPARLPSPSAASPGAAPPVLGPVAPAPAAPSDSVIYGAARVRTTWVGSLGYVTTIVGIVGLVGGAVAVPVGHAVKADNSCRDASDSLRFDCDYGGGSELITAGVVGLVVGGGLTAGGIVMMVMGVESTEPKAGVTAGRPGLSWSF